MRYLFFIFAVAAFGQSTNKLEIIPKQDLSATGRLGFRDKQTSPHTFWLRAPSILATDLTVTLPTGYGTAGQCFSTDGSGGIGFVTCGVGSTDLIPDTNNAYDIGSNTFKWKGIYAATLTAAGTTTLGTLRLPNTTPGVGKIAMSDALGYVSWGDLTAWSTSIIPSADISFSLGDATHRWTNIYGNAIVAGNSLTAPHVYAGDITQGFNVILDSSSNLLNLGNITASGILNFGTSATPHIYLWDGGTAGRYGLGIGTSELQSFIPGSSHWSWNTGGDQQSTGANEIMRLTTAGMLTLASIEATGTIYGPYTVAGTYKHGTAGSNVEIIDASRNILNIGTITSGDLLPAGSNNIGAALTPWGSVYAGALIAPTQSGLTSWRFAGGSSVGKVWTDSGSGYGAWQAASSEDYLDSTHDWSQSPSGSISPGDTTITLTPVPFGVNHNDYGNRHNVWVAGTGSPEACYIVTAGAGTGLAGDASGTITIHCSGSHSAGFTVGSASAGAAEAIYDAQSHGGGIVRVGGSTAKTWLASVSVDGTGIKLQPYGAGLVVANGAGLIMSGSYNAVQGNRTLLTASTTVGNIVTFIGCKNCVISGLTLDRSGTAASGGNGIEIQSGDNSYLAGYDINILHQYVGILETVAAAVSTWSQVNTGYNVSHGWWWKQVNDAHVTNVLSSTNGGDGIRVGNGASTTYCIGALKLSNGGTYANSGDGVHVEGKSGASCTYIYLDNWQADTDAGFEFYAKYAAAISIGNSQFINGYGVKLDSNIDTFSMSGSRINNALQTGLYLGDTVHSVNLSGNFISDSSYSAASTYYQVYIGDGVYDLNATGTTLATIYNPSAGAVRIQHGAGTAPTRVHFTATQLIGSAYMVTPLNIDTGLTDVFVDWQVIPGKCYPFECYQQGGNSFGATMNLGSNDAQSLVIRTNGTGRARFFPTGELSIGTLSAPTAGYELNVTGKSEFIGDVDLWGTTTAHGDMFFSKGASPFLGTNGVYDLRLGVNSVDILTLDTSGNAAFTGNVAAVGSIAATGPLYGQDLYIGGLLTIGGGRDLHNIGDVATSLVPDVDNTKYLGGASRYWKSIYVNNVLASTFQLTGGAVNGYFLKSDGSGNASWAAGGTGVTSVATSSPITGGTITSTGTIGCATCVTTSGGQTIAGGAYSNTLTMSSANIAVSGTVNFGASGSHVSHIFEDYNSIYTAEYITNGAGLYVQSGGTLSINSGGTLTTSGGNGQSVTTTVRASGGLSDCTLIFTNGVKTGGTC